MKPDTIELVVDRLVFGGYGLAHGPDGIVLVRGALPGERVTARPRMVDGVLRAHAIEVLESHPRRVEIPLPPGADLPLEYGAQLPVKEALVRDAIERVGKFDARLEPIAASPRSLGYRTAAQYAVAGGRLGARSPGSNAVVDLAEDVLAADPVRRLYATLRTRTLHGVSEVAFRGSILEDAAVVALIGDRRAASHHARAIERHASGVCWAEPDGRGRFRGRTELLSGADSLTEDFGGIHATVSVLSFAQVNPLAGGALFAEAAQIAGSGERALDLYAGSGILGMHLARSFEEVIAVEISADSVRIGDADARRQKARVRFHRGDARAAKRFFPADVVAVDPPRAGMEREVLEMIVAGAPQRILYVSCAPVTWARDAARLIEAGYRPSFVRPYDFYPFTHHVEVLSLFEK